MGLGNTPALWNIHSLVIAGGTQEVWGPRARPIVMATMATIVEFDEFNKKKVIRASMGQARRCRGPACAAAGPLAIGVFASEKREAPKHAQARRYPRGSGH